MAAKRELIAPKGDKRNIRRDEAGRIKESDDVGRSLAADRRTKAKTTAKPRSGLQGRPQAVTGTRAIVARCGHAVRSDPARRARRVPILPSQH